MNVKKIDGITVLVIGERLDAIDGPKLKDVVKELAKESGLNLVIDMGRTLLLDSTGCGGLVSSLKTCNRSPGVSRLGLDFVELQLFRVF